VRAKDAYSETLLNLFAKVQALEDCMAQVKKAFEKRSIDLTTMLRII